jgi:DNA polymerase III subunit delta'
VRYEDIIGQTEAVTRLKNMVNEARVPHALLFSGREGYGVLPAAVVFSQHLLCAHRRPEGPCNECPQCRRAAALVHPDLHLVFPLATSKKVRTSDDLLKEFRELFQVNPYMTLNDWFNSLEAENKQPVIIVEESASILKKLSYTSYEGSYRIMLIWHPEAMNVQASNKLLKILEEPPDNTIFILVSSRADQLLATILSRVQQIHFHASTDAEITESLKLRFSVDERTAVETALLAEGSYGDAVALLESNDSAVSLLNRFQTFMRLALRFDAVKAMAWVEEFSRQGREQHKHFLQYALGVFRNCLMYNYGERSLVKLSGEERDFLTKFAAFIHSGNYERLIEEFNKDYYHIERNANPKILFTDLFLFTNEMLNIKAA